MPQLEIERVQRGLASDPTLYPQNLCFSRQAILMLALDRTRLSAASFLDDRILTPQTEGRWTPFRTLEPWLQQPVLQRPTHFIFHAGHVGSTLLSRLLDDAGGVLGLREPLPLRVLAEALDDADRPHAIAGLECAQKTLAWFTKLWGRGFIDTKAVVIKATSSAARVGPQLLRALPGARAICLNLRAETYVSTLLAGENSHIDLRGQGPERFRRLTRLAGDPPRPLHTMSLGEIAALSWLTETLTHQSLDREFGAAVMRMDFDALLRSPEQTLRAACLHFELDVAEDFLAGVPNSPVLKRYSKAPEHTYSPALRDQILAQSRERNADEIHRGMQWLELFARNSSTAQQALSATTSA